MTARLGINGFGRIGRLAFRAAWERPGLDVVHVNEPAGTPESAAHLLEFDSVHGRWPHQPSPGDHGFTVAGRPIGLSQARRIEAVDWGARGVDIVLECSGQYRSAEALQPYLAQGVRTVVVSAPIKSEVLNVVVGVNDHLFDPDTHRLVSAASCTTNCLAPVVKVIHEGLGIRHGMITTVHDVTNTQTVVDAPGNDLRRARSGLLSLIPTTTGSAMAIGLIYPELAGKLNGHAVRVPLLNASMTDCVFEVARPTDAEEVNALLQAAAEGPLQGVLGFEPRPLVSVDFLNDTRSSIVDGPSTMVVDGTQVKVFAWYDNEMGYTHRLLDIAQKAASALPVAA